MINLQIPPIKEPLFSRNGIVGIIWNSFFVNIYKLLSQPSYGNKVCTFTISGITGTYSTSYKWVSDRDFVHFSVKIIPGTTITLSGASILPVLTNSQNFNDSPLNISNIQISMISGTTIKDFRTLVATTTGLINLPDATATPYTLLVSGSFIKSF